MKRWQSVLLGLLISGIALALAMNGVPLNELGNQLSQANYVWAVPCVVISALGLFFRALRWRGLLDNKVSVGHSYNILNIGYFFNSMLPLRLGEVARIFMATRLTPPIPIFTTLSTIVVERLLDILSVVGLVIIALTITPNVPPEVRRAAVGSAALGVVGLILLIGLAARRSIAHAIVARIVRIFPLLERLNPIHLTDRVLDGIAPLTRIHGVVPTLGWNIAGWVASVVAGYALMPAFYPEGNWAAALLMIAIASLAIALPAVPGSVGPFELAIITGLAGAGLVPDGDPDARARAMAFAVVLHILNVIIYVGTGYIGLLREKMSIGQIIEAARGLTRRKPADPETTAAQNSQA